MNYSGHTVVKRGNEPESVANIHSQGPTASSLTWAAIDLCCHWSLGFCTSPTFPWRALPSGTFLRNTVLAPPSARLTWPISSILIETLETFWVNFFKERKTLGHNWKKSIPKALNSLQRSEFVPNWREQFANSSSGAVRMLASNLLWLSSLQERHVSTADSSINYSFPRQVTDSPLIPLDSVQERGTYSQSRPPTTPTTQYTWNCSENSN
jgi:hypothetical protein